VTSGVRRVDRPAGEVVADARLRGATVGTVTAARTRRSVLSEIGRALRFPGWYGHNLDALFDCLTDLSWLPAGEVVLVWDGSEALRHADAPAYRAVLDVLAEAAAETGGTSRPLTVLLTGPPLPSHG
jgi:RNAse (barnase) inhibitor barstar